MSTSADPRRLPAFVPAQRRSVNVVIETARGSRNKFAYDEDAHLFRLSKVLPEGMVFPYDFGFVPSTVADDGDPLDVLVLMDEAAFAGCLVTCRVIGAILGDQTDPGAAGKPFRNDRIVAVAEQSRVHEDVEALGDLNGSVLGQIEVFFVNYHALRGGRYRLRGRRGPQGGWQLVNRAARKWRAAGRQRGR